MEIFICSDENQYMNKQLWEVSYEAMGYSRKGNKRGDGISHKITYVNVNRFKFVKVEEN